jgi:hypothetical protein
MSVENIFPLHIIGYHIAIERIKIFIMICIPGVPNYLGSLPLFSPILREIGREASPWAPLFRAFFFPNHFIFPIFPSPMTFTPKEIAMTFYTKKSEYNKNFRKLAVYVVLNAPKKFARVTQTC